VIHRLTRLTLRLAATLAFQLMKLRWLMQRPQVRGAHALALTPAGAMILVRLRYAPGWRFPGGGVGRGEDPADAVLRELREEIGLTGFEAIRFAFEESRQVHSKRDCSSIFVVGGVSYSRKWSLEVEEICAFPLDEPPHDLSPTTARWLARLRAEGLAT
jgi:8-oxo-dGTP pyrophosphatase MutT (NUDIX family)